MVVSKYLVDGLCRPALVLRLRAEKIGPRCRAFTCQNVPTSSPATLITLPLYECHNHPTPPVTAIASDCRERKTSTVLIFFFLALTAQPPHFRRVSESVRLTSCQRYRTRSSLSSEAQPAQQTSGPDEPTLSFTAGIHPSSARSRTSVRVTSRSYTPLQSSLQ